MVILPFTLNCIQEISSLKLNNLPTDLSSEHTKELIFKTMLNVTAKTVPVLPIESNDPEAIKLKALINESQKEKDKLKHLEPELKKYQ